jgi:hypothetical protein
MPPAEFEPATPVNDRPQTLALKRVSTEIGPLGYWNRLHTHTQPRNTDIKYGVCVWGGGGTNPGIALNSFKHA